METGQVRVWEDRVAVGAQQAVHRHDRPYLSVAITGGSAEIVGPDGEMRDAFERKPGDAVLRNGAIYRSRTRCATPGRLRSG